MSEDEVYNVEKIVSHTHKDIDNGRDPLPQACGRKSGYCKKEFDRHRIRRYFVKWQGYPSSDNTWEPAEEKYEEIPLIIDTYWNKFAEKYIPPKTDKIAEKKIEQKKKIVAFADSESDGEASPKKPLKTSVVVDMTKKSKKKKHKKDKTRNMDKTDMKKNEKGRTTTKKSKRDKIKLIPQKCTKDNPYAKQEEEKKKKKQFKEKHRERTTEKIIPKSASKKRKLVSPEPIVRTVGVDENGNKIRIRVQDGDQKIRLFSREGVKPADIIKYKNLKVTRFVRGRQPIGSGFMLTYNKKGRLREYMLPVNSSSASRNLQKLFKGHIQAFIASRVAKSKK